MKDLTINKNTFSFDSITGEVLSQNKFSETHVSGGGGGGSHGHTRSVSISSQAITKHEFWIKTDDGREEAIQLSGADVAIREGQRISLITIWNPSKDTGYYAMLVNHTAQTKDFLLDYAKLGYKNQYKVAKAGWGTWLIGIALIAMIAGPVYSSNGSVYKNVDILATAGCAGGLWSLIVFPIIYFTANAFALKHNLKLIKEHVNDLADELLRKENARSNNS